MERKPKIIRSSDVKWVTLSDWAGTTTRATNLVNGVMVTVQTAVGLTSTFIDRCVLCYQDKAIEPSDDDEEDDDDETDPRPKVLRTYSVRPLAADGRIPAGWKLA